MRSSATLTLWLAPLAGLALPVAGQQDVLLNMKQGDEVLGNGNITTFRTVTVSNRGLVYADVLTNNSSANAAVTINGFLVMQKGIPLASPEDVEFKEAIGMSINSSSYFGWSISLQGDGIKRTTNNEGVYWNTLKLIQKGDRPFTPGIGEELFPDDPNKKSNSTTYNGFTNAWINDDNDILVLGIIDDPNKNGLEPFLSLLKTDGLGNLVSEEFLAVKKYKLPSTGDRVEEVPIGNDFYDFNNRGDWIANLVINAASTLVMNGEVIGRGLDPSPLPGRLITGFGNLGLNNFGEYAVIGVMDGSKSDNDAILINNHSEIFIRENDSFAAISPQKISKFETAPVELADSGDIYWFAITDDAAGQDELYCRNRTIIAQEGVTLVDNLPISSLRFSTNAFDISPSGRFWVGEVLLSNGTEAILFGDYGAAIPIPGCGGPGGVPLNTATLKKVAGDARVGETMRFEIDGPALPGATSSFWFSTRPAIVGSPCGIRVGSQFELLVGKPFSKIQGTTYDGTNPAEFTVTVPFDLTLVDRTVYGQAVLLDATRAHVSNGFSFELGNPPQGL